MCPGRYQAVRQNTDPAQSLLVAVSGVDYQDRPLQTARPAGITGIVGLGFGGVAWSSADAVPPPLTGSSVSTAVVSAVSALVWAFQPLWTPRQVTKAVYNGGVVVNGGPKPECPLLLSQCISRRASVCGALHAAGAVTECVPAAPKPWSSPYLPTEMIALDNASTNFSPGMLEPAPLPLPRYSIPGGQITPWTLPMPVEETCPPCRSSQGHLYIPARDKDLVSPVVVVQQADGSSVSRALRPSNSQSNSLPYMLLHDVSYSFDLSGLGSFVSAYITAYGPSPQTTPPAPPPYSITEQIFVQP